MSYAATLAAGLLRVAACDIGSGAGDVVCRHLGGGLVEGGGLRHRIGRWGCRYAATLAGACVRVAACDIGSGAADVVRRHLGDRLGRAAHQRRSTRPATTRCTSSQAAATRWLTVPS